MTGVKRTLEEMVLLQRQQAISLGGWSWVQVPGSENELAPANKEDKKMLSECASGKYLKQNGGRVSSQLSYWDSLHGKYVAQKSMGQSPGPQSSA